MFEQSLLESACLARSHRALTTSLSALAQLILLGIAILLPVVFTKSVPLLKPRIPPPVMLPRMAPPEPEPIVRRSHASAPAIANQTVVVTNAFPPVQSVLTSTSSNPEAIVVPAGPGPVNYDLPIGVRDPATHLPGPSAPLRSQLDEGRIIRRVQPIYPPLAKAARIEGEVLIEAIISRTGKIEELRIISGHPILAAAAKDAVTQWLFRPYVLNGKPIDVITQVRVDFKLQRE